MITIEGGITSPKGFKAAGVKAGIKKDKLDLAVIYSELPARCATAYTQNKARAAPIQVMMEDDAKSLRAFVINSGNANALTGPRGYNDARDMQRMVGDQLRLEPKEVGVASTGVIGRFLPMDLIGKGIVQACKELDRSVEADIDTAKAIMTTDTKMKSFACQTNLRDGTLVTVAGIAKGSGMISPAMRTLHATTLSFVSTDARLERDPSGKWQQIMDSSFNVINVDGDQSTNDISSFMANGAAGGGPADDDPSLWEAVMWVAKSLAKAVAVDGEGATKLIEVLVTGAKDDQEARVAARSVVASNLVKAAVFGADPNFGRILAALGNSGSDFDIAKVRLHLSNGKKVTLFDNGSPLIIPGSNEENLARNILKEKRILIELDLGVGHGRGEAWGCDLSYEYVKINASYTT
ncbi:MAG: bifunctional ornithine acetyltransferase/N-acetylglutamate synthase [Methanomassiliicoccales archaeon]|jgi:glutamate N-acetyltransferase/amino-acid N-acetyltransferase|nr:bifunctional ornithine acetyltransferase/N-acetylglutamate synthase [Methanomassiliicoccales archaeon]